MVCSGKLSPSQQGSSGWSTCKVCSFDLIDLIDFSRIYIYIYVIIYIYIYIYIDIHPGSDGAGWYPDYPNIMLGSQLELVGQVSQPSYYSWHLPHAYGAIADQGYGPDRVHRGEGPEVNRLVNIEAFLHFSILMIFWVPKKYIVVNPRINHQFWIVCITSLWQYPGNNLGLSHDSSLGHLCLGYLGMKLG